MKIFASWVRHLVRQHLEWVFKITTTRPRFVLAGCFLVFLVSAASITRISFETDIFKLFPQKGPLALFLDIMDWTGSAGNAYFLVEGDREKIVREAEGFAAKLKALKVDGRPGFTSVKYRVFDREQAGAFAEFVGYAAVRPQLFLSESEVPEYAERLEPARVKKSLERAKAELSLPGAFTDAVAADPLYLRELVLPRLKAASESLDFDPSSPYFISRNGKALIIIAEPARPVTDLQFARKLVAGIETARRGAGVSISYTGAHLSAVTDEAVMKKEVLIAVFSSLLLVLALFFVAYRRLLPTLLIPVILAFGVVLAVAAGGMIYPTLSVISFAFASLIVGIGTDYTIHMYDRFHFERASGKGTDEALHLAVVDTGHALFTAGTTTAFPFLALMISDVRALAELGLLVGLGVIFSLYATLFFLPPLLLFMDRRFPVHEYQPLPTFGLTAVWSLTRRFPKRVLALTAGTVVFFCIACTAVSFESELKNLQPKSSEAFQTQEKLERNLNISPRQTVLAVEGGEIGIVFERGSRIAAIAETFRKRGALLSYSSLSQVINGAETQKKISADFRAGFPVSSGGGEITSTMAREGFDAELFRPYAEALAAIPNAPPIPVSDAVSHLATSPFRGIVDRHLIRTAEGYHYLIYLNYRGAEFPQQEFLAKAKQVDPELRSTGVDLVSRQLGDSVKRSFRWGATVGAILVLFLLLSHFSSPAGIFYSLFPLFAGVVGMLGIMGLTGMKLNFMNVMVIVTIIGMGSDYGLHVAHRTRNCGEEEYPGRFVQSGRAVLLSALTTIMGFGSLALTDYGALSSIGWATSIGVAMTALFVAVLPACMFYIRFPREKEL